MSRRIGVTFVALLAMAAVSCGDSRPVFLGHGFHRVACPKPKPGVCYRVVAENISGTSGTAYCRAHFSPPGTIGPTIGPLVIRGVPGHGSRTGILWAPPSPSPPALLVDAGCEPGPSE